MAKSMLYDLEKGNLEWEDEKVQFMLPGVLYFTDFDVMKVAADNMLIEEDAVIVKNFLDKLQALSDINGDRLHQTVENKLERLFKGMM